MQQRATGWNQTHGRSSEDTRAPALPTELPVCPDELKFCPDSHGMIKLMSICLEKDMNVCSNVHGDAFTSFQYISLKKPPGGAIGNS